jgi:hypothetical protein
VETARARRRDDGISPADIERVTTIFAEIEHRCRERIRPALKSILTEDQYAVVLVMEENHRKRIRERRRAP